MSFTIGSLFDGSGGFPLAAFMCGGVPVWASEVEPYPIAVTKTRFPYMKHLGSVTDVKGNEIEPVDVITFGSPCQDLSIAGKRAGLKHEDNGDEETTRSGLFMEAVRIIKEMREATNGVYPRIALWENVPGAFSSNKGEDFRVVLEELIKIVEPTAVMPTVPKNGWPYSDYYSGDGWSLAYRVLDAQYWGVPQRRRRIYLVLDLGGQCAGEISFERHGLRGYFEEGRAPWESLTGDAERSPGTADCETDGVTYCGSFLPQKKAEAMGWSTDDVSCTLHNGACAGFQNAVVTCKPVGVLASSAVNAEVTDGTISPCLMARAGTGGNQLPLVAIYDARGNGDGSTVSTITGDHNNRVTDYTSLVCYGIGNGQANQPLMEEKVGALNCMHDQQAVMFGINGDVAGTLDASYYKGCGMRQGVEREVVFQATNVAGVDCRNFTESPELYPTLQAKSNGGQSLNYSGAVRTQYIVRRLTPTECARLQGFPDGWGHPDHKDSFTEDEYRFWLNVRNTHAEINGKAVKSYTKDQMLTWYNKLHTDSSEYKLWGNGIALPTALYMMQGIAEVFK